MMIDREMCIRSDKFPDVGSKREVGFTESGCRIQPNQINNKTLPTSLIDQIQTIPCSAGLEWGGFVWLLSVKD